MTGRKNSALARRPERKSRRGRTTIQRICFVSEISKSNTRHRIQRRCLLVTERETKAFLKESTARLSTGRDKRATWKIKQGLRDSLSVAMKKIKHGKKR